MPSVSVIIPTKNESRNIIFMVAGIQTIFENTEYEYEIIVVDDSDDITPKIAEMMGARVINGKRKGLGQAILDGINDSQKDIVLVMDADLSHPITAIPYMLKPLSHGYDMTIGSRYCKGGATEGWELSRRIISRCACLLATPITLVKDATSGFFAFRREIIKDVKLEPSSWKIMLEVLLKSRPMRICEVPIIFKVREHGKSKFNSKQMVAYIKHIGLLAFWKYQRFIKFCVVGGIGSAETFGLTWILTEQFHLFYMMSLVFAVAFATVSNYTLNTLWTYRLGKSPKDADYEWFAFYKGNFVQKWWKRQIAKTVWNWTDQDAKTLDCGCGSSPIVTNYNTSSMGIDQNDSKLSFMQSRCANVIFKKMELKSISESYQQVLCIEVVEHLEYPSEMIAEMARVTNKGGKVIIATPDYSRILWKLAERFTPYKEEHITRFNRESLEKMCRPYGLKPVKHRYVAGCDLIEMFEKV